MEEMFKILSVLKCYITEITNSAVAVATLLLAVATWKMAKLTQKTLEAQFKPYVIIYAELDKNFPEDITLVVENIGTAPAVNIRFELPEYFPWRADGLKSGGKKKAENLTRGPLRNGMKYLAPGNTWRSYWGQYGGIFDSLDGKHVEIIVYFSRSDGQQLEPTKNILDVRDFSISGGANSYSKRQTDALEKQARALESIRKDIRKLVNEGNRKPTGMKNDTIAD